MDAGGYDGAREVEYGPGLRLFGWERLIIRTRRERAWARKKGRRRVQVGTQRSSVAASIETVGAACGSSAHLHYKEPTLLNSGLLSEKDSLIPKRTRSEAHKSPEKHCNTAAARVICGISANTGAGAITSARRCSGAQIRVLRQSSKATPSTASHRPPTHHPPKPSPQARFHASICLQVCSDCL